MAAPIPIVFLAQTNGQYFRVVVLRRADARQLHVTDGTHTTEDDAYLAAFNWCATQGYNVDTAKKQLRDGTANKQRLN